ncbi:hypothetical protein Tco_0262561 [Tanacetum coccineum]
MMTRFDSEAGKFGTEGIPTHRLFSFEELKNATNNFHISILIGEGSTVKANGEGVESTQSYVSELQGLQLLALARSIAVYEDGPCYAGSSPHKTLTIHPYFPILFFLSFLYILNEILWLVDKVPRPDHCDKKIVRIPLGDETLTIRSNRSDGYASIVASDQRVELFDMIGTLERDNMRLKGMLDVERQRVDRLWHSMSYAQRIYKTQFLTLGSSDIVRKKEGWILQDVHQLPRIEQANHEEPLPVT